tara:strand:+ start:1103 stop:1426 length:324 start_codon:yes stop_codon:yes gene_type:complete
MNKSNKERIADALDQIRIRIFQLSTHSLELHSRVPANVLIWFAMSNNLLDLHIRQLKEKLEENNLSTEVSMDKIDSVLPGDSEYLQAAQEVIICLDEMTQSLEDRRH